MTSSSSERLVQAIEVVLAALGGQAAPQGLRPEVREGLRELFELLDARLSDSGRPSGPAHAGRLPHRSTKQDPLRVVAPPAHPTASPWPDLAEAGGDRRGTADDAAAWVLSWILNRLPEAERQGLVSKDRILPILDRFVKDWRAEEAADQ
ncbi:MAG: hypothetical protein AAGD06_16690 [Acidobacteriota bacterium]